LLRHRPVFQLIKPVINEHITNIFEKGGLSESQVVKNWNFMKGQGMPEIFNEKLIKFKFDEAPIPEFSWHSSPKLSKLVKSKHLVFDITSLDPDSFSCPYHFHHNAEELFIILSGSATLRTQNEFKTVNEGDIIFFEIGPTGAHQLYNHTKKPCRYLDCRTSVGIDLCEYPDSKKVNIIPLSKIYDASNEVDFYKNEEKIREKWPKEIMGKRTKNKRKK
jgi:uncharacterized cupin superfamily protein